MYSPSDNADIYSAALAAATATALGSIISISNVVFFPLYVIVKVFVPTVDESKSLIISAVTFFVKAKLSSVVTERFIFKSAGAIPIPYIFAEESFTFIEETVNSSDSETFT